MMTEQTKIFRETLKGMESKDRTKAIVSRGIRFDKYIESIGFHISPNTHGPIVCDAEGRTVARFQDKEYWGLMADFETYDLNASLQSVD